MNSEYRPSPITLYDLEPGIKIGPEDNRFLLVREIGGGGMGKIWLARDLEEEKLEGGEQFKALKIVNPLLRNSPRALEALKREAARASKLSHPNIINVYGYRLSSDGWPFVSMDYLEGRDLDRLLADEGQLSWPRTLELLRPIAAALDYAHQEHGLIHRDLKPGNVFITRAGQVKLLDFGVAHRLRLTRSVVNVQASDSSGTPEYMPPEAFTAGKPEPTQDVYALACLTYEMLTGDPPYTPEAAMLRNPALLPSPPPELTDAAWAVLKRGLAYDKQDRPGTAGELVEQLATAQQPAQRPKKPADRSFHLFLILVMAGLLGGSGVYAWQKWFDDSLQSSRDLAEFRDKLKDGAPGPVMIQIPAGEFLMGSPEDEPGRDSDEGPQHEVQVPAFAIARTETTVGQFRAFVEDTGYETDAESGNGCFAWNANHNKWEQLKERDWRNPGFTQTEAHPVICVSWNDTVAYAGWLSKQTGERYRLPTEAEWEYAARAGTTTPFWTGDCIHTDQANYGGNVDYNGCGANTGVSRGQTVAAGSLQANAWGLHDTAGNVWEWVQDCWHDSYRGAPADGSAWEEPGCARRVVRGGGWFSRPQLVRSANRYGYAPDAAYDILGFRLARD